MRHPTQQNVNRRVGLAPPSLIGGLKPALRVLFLMLLALSGCDRKDSFPNRPITFICPWGAGGGTDRISRQLAFLLEQELGVPVNVVNATGGGGVTGHSRGARARADGYTITMVTVELNMLHWRGLTSISHEDFQPVMMVNEDAAAVFVRTDSRWKTLGELERAIRDEPGKLKASGTAFGGIWHVALAGWLTTIGLQASDVTWIAMSGAAPSLQELMADGLDIVACSLPEAQVLLKADKVRCLGVMADRRLPAYPEIPTFQETGVDWQVSTHRGIALPAGVSESRAAIIEDAVEQAAKSKEFLEYMENTGAGAAAVPSQEYARFLKETDKAFGKVFAGPSFQGFRHKYGPMLFPAVLSGLLGICLVACIVSGSLRRIPERQEMSRTTVLDMAILAGCVVLYVLTAETFGFVLSSAVILLILFSRMHVKSAIAIPATILLAGFVYQLFAVGLRVPLPRGFLGW
ncbi:MAG: tripartite tricarboxylate transporter substrate-binding protein [Planctomycetota bacterium]